MFLEIACRPRFSRMRSFLAGCAVVLVAASESSARRATGVVAATCPQSPGLTFQAAAPQLGQVLTHVTVATMASFGTASGPAFYSVSVHNGSGSSATFRLVVELKFIPSDPSLASSFADPYPDGESGCWIQRQSTYDITLDANKDWTKTSNQVNRFVTGGISGDDSPFRSLLDRTGDIPAGRMILTLGLACSTDGQDPMDASNSSISRIPGTDWLNFSGTYQPARSPQLVSPGAPSGSGFPALVASPPVFVFSGNLDRAYTGGTAPYRILVWELPADASLDQVQSVLPTRTLEVRRGVVPWPTSWPALEPGKRYVWRVDALLHGVTDDWLPSSTWEFSVPYPASPAGSSGANLSATASQVMIPQVSGTPEQNEMAQLLALLAGPFRPGVEPELRTKLPDPSSLLVAGRPATLEELRNLVQDVLAGRLSVRAAGVEK